VITELFSQWTQHDYMGWLKMLDVKLADHQNCRAWNCRTWNRRTNVQDMK